MLIVEKNDFLRRSLREAIEARFPDCRCEDTGDGRVALQKVQAGLPDMAFVDIRPHGMNGLNLIARMKEVHPGMEVCLLTDTDLPEYLNCARECGADHCFAKDTLTSARLYGFIAPVLEKAARRTRMRAKRRKPIERTLAAPSAVLY